MIQILKTEKASDCLYKIVMKLIFVTSFWVSSLLVMHAGMISGIQTDLGEIIPEPKSEQIEFRIGFGCTRNGNDVVMDHEKKKTSKLYSDSVYCLWRNISKEPVSFLLKDHDDFHGTLDYPFGIEIRITDCNGVVLTATSSRKKEGWWASSCMHSQFSRITPGDIITLKPNEYVIRSIGIDDVIGGLTFVQARDKAAEVPRMADGSVDMRKTKVHSFKMPEGKNRIEVKYWGLVAKNSIVLDVKDMSNKADVEALTKKGDRDGPKNPWTKLKADLVEKQKEMDALIARLGEIYYKDKRFLEELDESQEKWKIYCDAMYELRFPDKSTRTGGSGGGINRYKFLIEMYNIRIAELRKWMRDGDE